MPKNKRKKRSEESKPSTNIDAKKPRVNAQLRTYLPSFFDTVEPQYIQYTMFTEEDPNEKPRLHLKFKSLEEFTASRKELLKNKTDKQLEIEWWGVGLSSYVLTDFRLCSAGIHSLHIWHGYPRKLAPVRLPSFEEEIEIGDDIHTLTLCSAVPVSITGTVAELTLFDYECFRALPLVKRALHLVVTDTILKKLPNERRSDNEDDLLFCERACNRLVDLINITKAPTIAISGAGFPSPGTELIMGDVKAIFIWNFDIDSTRNILNCFDPFSNIEVMLYNPTGEFECLVSEFQFVKKFIIYTETQEEPSKKRCSSKIQRIRLKAEFMSIFEILSLPR